MIVECSKCKTSFKVDQNLISQKAKVFQCSLCKNVWAIENDQALWKIKDKELYAYGVYQIEANGLKLFDYVKGDKDSIMGLPIKEIINYIKKLK